MALVDQILDFQAAERDTFSGFTDMGEDFGGRPFPLGAGGSWTARVSRARVSASSGEW